MNSSLYFSLHVIVYLNQGCNKRFIKRFYASCQQIKRFLIPPRLVSTCLSFPVHVDYSSFDSFKANEICEQIGLFLISTRGCGSHSWKLLKSPIYSRVQLIPNCFSNRPISYTNLNSTMQFRFWTFLSHTAISINVVGSKHKARSQDRKVMWDFFE